MGNNPKILCVIPARGGSKGIRNKNGDAVFIKADVSKEKDVKEKEQDVKIKKEIEDGVISGPQSGDDISSGKY